MFLLHIIYSLYINPYVSYVLLSKKYSRWAYVSYVLLSIKNILGVLMYLMSLCLKK